MTAMVTIENLHKTYRAAWFKPPVHAVRGISLEIEQGEAFGLIGPNGAGKSTTIKILVGAMSASSGGVAIGGLAVGRPEARRGMGYVPENPCLSDYLTPLEVLLMGIRLHGVRVPNERAHCLSWLERFGLDGVANRHIRTFSKGMTQRTALAHALAIKPRFLLLDEPLSGLDPVGRRDVVELFSEYHRAGGTLLFTSHVLHDVERLASRFGLINAGKLVTVRSPEEVAAGQAGRYVVRYRGEQPIGGSREIRSGVHEVDAESTDLTVVIATIQMKNGVIQEVRPAVSLETAFFRMLDNPDLADRAA